VEILKLSSNNETSLQNQLHRIQNINQIPNSADD